MDSFLFQIFNGWAGRSSLLDDMMIAVTSYGPYVFAGILVLLLLSKRWRAAAMTSFASVALSLGINYIIKLLFYRARPFVQEKAQLLLEHDPDSSFPSNHTTAAVAIACVLWHYDRKIGGPLIGLAVWMGISRIYVGHHYPSDVLAGIIFGVISTVVALRIASKVVKRKKATKHLPSTMHRG